MDRLQVADGPRSFARAPVGRYVAGPGWIHWCRTPALFGIVLWGRLDRRGGLALTRSLDAELGVEASPHACVVDAREVNEIEPAACASIRDRLETDRHALGRAVERIALVTPPGVASLIASGMSSVFAPGVPLRVFTSSPEALSWAGASGDAAGMYSDARPLTLSLRTELARLGYGVAAAEAARALGMTERTLQRRLRTLGTTFVAERAAARHEAARARVGASDEPLTTIAFELGFASLPHFSAQFRRREGISPTAWRAATTGASLSPRRNRLSGI